MVLDVAQSYQLEAGESQDLCGNYGVATLALADKPGNGPRGNAENIDSYADWLATLYNAGPTNEQGSTEEQMYTYLIGAVENFGPTPSGNRLLHFWVIPTDTPSIRRAIEAGYPVLVTANEQNIRDVNTGKRPPYAWNLNANHIIPLMGVDKNGHWVVPDYLNNNSGWPFSYDESVLAPSWACCIQVVGPDQNNPLLAPIPSGTPLSWDANFNAQLFAQTGNRLPPTTPPPPTDRVLSIEEALSDAQKAGFSAHDTDIIIVAIASAESELHTVPKDNVNSDGSRDRGILQINSKAHAEVSDSCCYDPVCAFEAAYTISKNGTNFSAWTTYTNGAWLTHVPDIYAVKYPAVYAQACAVWDASSVKAPRPTGIFAHWLLLYMTVQLGPPVTLEIETNDWNDVKNTLVAQWFTGYHVELKDSLYTVYDSELKGTQL